MIKPHSVPLVYAHERAAGALWCRGGIALLRQSLEGKFIVSAAHVWRGLVAHRDQLRGRMSIFIGLAPKVVSLLEAEPISIDDDLDIVILRAPPKTDALLGKKAFYQTLTWRQVPAADGETLGVLGFPGEICRSQQFTVEMESFYYENTCAVSSRGTNLLIGAFAAEPPVTVVHVDHPVSAIMDFGGLSGAPAFALRDGKPVWVGVVKQGAADKGISAGLQATLCHYVRADGTLQPM